MKNSDTGGSGEMTDEQLDQLLAAANSELLEHIEATANPTQVLSDMTTPGGRQDARPAGPAAPAGGHGPEQAFTAAMIGSRIRACDLASAIRSARGFAEATTAAAAGC